MKKSLLTLLLVIAPFLFFGVFIALVVLADPADSKNLTPIATHWAQSLGESDPLIHRLNNGYYQVMIKDKIYTVKCYESYNECYIYH